MFPWSVRLGQGRQRDVRRGRVSSSYVVALAARFGVLPIAVVHEIRESETARAMQMAWCINGRARRSCDHASLVCARPVGLDDRAGAPVADCGRPLGRTRGVAPRGGPGSRCAAGPPRARACVACQRMVPV